MKNQPPTILLIETWVALAHNNKFPDAQKSIIEKINTIFDSIYEAELYLEMEKLKCLRKVF